MAVPGPNAHMAVLYGYEALTCSGAGVAHRGRASLPPVTIQSADSRIRD
ncbi:MAG: hypothetical protein ACK48U_19510 [Planctomyces sp.]